MQFTYYGHAAFELETGGKKLEVIAVADADAPVPKGPHLPRPVLADLFHGIIFHGGGLCRTPIGATRRRSARRLPVRHQSCAQNQEKKQSIARQHRSHFGIKKLNLTTKAASLKGGLSKTPLSGRLAEFPATPFIAG